MKEENPFIPSYSIEKVGGGVEICITASHTFGTDSFLLSYFAAPKPGEMACDLGSGCGIIPLLWFRGKKQPKAAYGVDIQPLAVQQMQASCARSGLAGKFFPIQADLRELKGRIPFASLKLVTCNPPYKALGTGLMSTAASDKIARHETMCTLDNLCASAAKLLQFGGRLCITQLPERLVDVFDAMRKHRLEPKRLRFVQQRPGDAPWLVLVEGRLGCKPFLTVEKPLILRNEDGSTSPEMTEIYGMYGKVEEAPGNDGANGN